MKTSTKPLIFSIFIPFFAALALIGGCADSQASAEKPDIPRTFEECVAAGNRVIKTYPGRCYLPDGTMFKQDIGDREVELVPQARSFEECAAQGNPVTRSLPAKCTTPGGTIFVQETELPAPPRSQKSLCVDRCGDGECQQLVCMGEGCPCAETSETCKVDCQ